MLICARNCSIYHIFCMVVRPCRFRSCAPVSEDNIVDLLYSLSALFRQRRRLCFQRRRSRRDTLIGAPEVPHGCLFYRFSYQTPYYGISVYNLCDGISFIYQYFLSKLTAYVVYCVVRISRLNNYVSDTMIRTYLCV